MKWTRGQGSIIPGSREQVIQTPDPGILGNHLRSGKAILLRKVRVLLTLMIPEACHVGGKSEARVNNPEAVRARLRAEAYSESPTFPDDACRFEGRGKVQFIDYERLNWHKASPALGRVRLCWIRK